MKNAIFLIGMVMMVLAIPNILAASTDDINVTNPTANYFGGAPLVIIAAISNGTGFSGSVVNNMTNVTFYYKLNSDSAWTLIGGNDTDNKTELRIGWDSKLLVDTLTYDFKAEAWSNLTGTGLLMASDTVSNIYPDNHVPVCSQSTLASNTKYDPDVTKTVSITVTNASACRVTFDNNRITLTESSDACTLTLNVLPDQIYSAVNFYSDDGRNETGCTKLDNVQIKGPRPTGGLINTALEEEKAKEDTGGILQSTIKSENQEISPILILVIIMVIIIIAYYSNKK